MRSPWWHACVVIASCFIAGCPAAVPVGDGGGVIDENGDDGDGDAGGTYTLEINIQGLAGNESQMTVSYFIDDVIRASTGDVSLISGGRRDCVTLEASETTCTVQVEPGKTVTLFGLESIGGGGVLSTPAVPEQQIVPSTAVELHDINGDCDTRPEDHACAVNMDGDKSVTVVYRQMNSITWELIGWPASLAADLTGDSPEIFGLPSFVPPARGEHSTFGAATTTLAPVHFVYGKTGTTIAYQYFDARDFPGSNDYARFIRWGGACLSDNLVDNPDLDTQDCVITINRQDLRVQLEFDYFLCGGVPSSADTGFGCPHACEVVPDRACIPRE